MNPISFKLYKRVLFLDEESCKKHLKKTKRKTRYYLFKMRARSSLLEQEQK